MFKPCLGKNHLPSACVLCIALYFHFQVFQVKWFLASNSSNGLKTFHIIFNCHYYFSSSPFFTYPPPPLPPTFHMLRRPSSFIEDVWMSLFSYIVLGISGSSYRFALRLVDEIGIFSVTKFTTFTVNFLMTFSISISYGVTNSHSMWLEKCSFFLFGSESTQHHSHIIWLICITFHAISEFRCEHTDVNQIRTFCT